MPSSDISSLSSHFSLWIYLPAQHRQYSSTPLNPLCPSVGQRGGASPLMLIGCCWKTGRELEQSCAPGGVHALVRLLSTHRNPVKGNRLCFIVHHVIQNIEQVACITMYKMCCVQYLQWTRPIWLCFRFGFLFHTRCLAHAFDWQVHLFFWIIVIKLP